MDPFWSFTGGFLLAAFFYTLMLLVRWWRKPKIQFTKLRIPHIKNAKHMDIRQVLTDNPIQPASRNAGDQVDGEF